MLTTLYGTSGPARDGKRLGPAEARLIDHYRSMDDAGRQMVRTLCERLARCSEQEPR